MNFEFTDKQNELRGQVREVVESELAAGSFEVDSMAIVAPVSQSFSKKMAERGWIGINWPEAYGGQGKGHQEKMIILEEMYRYHAPTGYHFMAERQIGPSLIKFGTQWQKEKFLPRIIKAEDRAMFCVLLSEPDAGSDLASVSTTAVKDGDYYIINGQKVWTSEAHEADYGSLIAKTNLDESVPKHQTCSEFIVDMKAQGVTIRPLINLAGVHNFNEVFFDNVKVHKKYMIGEENNGFKQIMAQVDFERSGIERLMQNYPVYTALKEFIDNMEPEDKKGDHYAWIRDTMAQIETEYQVGRLMCYQTAWIIDQGRKPTIQAATSKAFCTQFEQRLNDLAMKIMGPVSTIRKGSKNMPAILDIAACYLWGASYTLQGGTIEVLKNIIAQRGLGLPR